MLTKGMKDQLKQLKKAGNDGIWYEHLTDLMTTRDLVKTGLAENSTGQRQALRNVYITDAGLAALRGTP
jgi:hypothetical protein